MAKKHFQRYLSIINILQRGKATFDEIDAYLREQCDITSVNFNFSKRTFQRDIQDIAEVHNIDIEYDRISKCYRIISSENCYQDRIKERLLENAQLNFALQIYNKADKWIDLDQRKPTSVEYIQLILKSLDRAKQLKFTHYSFWKGASSKTVEPLGLKEFKQRWYLVARDTKDGAVKIYSLDRISNLENGNIGYTYPQSFYIHHYFTHAFGVDVGQQTDTPKQVTLSFTPFQANYIKTLPLHPSQKIISDTSEELRVTLTVLLTFDFEMEILAMGEHVRVIAPLSFRDKIAERLGRSLNNYSL